MALIQANCFVDAGVEEVFSQQVEGCASGQRGPRSWFCRL